VEDPFHHRFHLVGIGGEVEFGVVAVIQPIVGKHIVDAEVAGVIGHVVNARVGEVAQQVGVVQPGHGDFRNTHFQKGGEGGKNALLAFLHAKTRRCGEVAPLLNAAADEHFRVGLANLSQPAGTFQIAIYHQNAIFAGGFVHASEHFDTASPKVLRLDPCLSEDPRKV
jgi:hypothetical protein